MKVEIAGSAKDYRIVCCFWGVNKGFVRKDQCKHGDLFFVV